MNPPVVFPDSRSVSGGSPSYTRPYDSAVIANTNAGTGASSNTATRSTEASSQQSVAINGPYSPHAPSGTSRTATQRTSGTNTSLVRSAQQELNDQGYSAGTVDGIMGPHTQAAIRKFQSAKGLRATGHLDSATTAALGVPQSQPSGSSTTGMNSNTRERVSTAGGTKSSSN